MKKPAAIEEQIGLSKRQLSAGAKVVQEYLSKLSAKENLPLTEDERRKVVASRQICEEWQARFNMAIDLMRGSAFASKGTDGTPIVSYRMEKDD